MLAVVLDLRWFFSDRLLLPVFFTWFRFKNQEGQLVSGGGVEGGKSLKGEEDKQKRRRRKEK